MNKREYNRDVKRLKNKVVKFTAKGEATREDLDTFENEVKAELSRLYYADTNFEYATKQSVLILFRLNLRFRVVQLHMFGIFINLEDI